MPIPKQTAEIFETLSKGQFICSNSSLDSVRRLYEVIDRDFDDLHPYFRSINFILERGDEYLYFSRVESKVDLERKIETAFKWIDVVDFLKTFDNSFGSGYRFTPSDILVKLNIDAELKTKLEGLKKHGGGKERFDEIIEKILDMLARDSFIEIENEISNTYKVLASFNYLEKLVLAINIPEEVINEIPE